MTDDAANDPPVEPIEPYDPTKANPTPPGKDIRERPNDPDAEVR